MNTGEDEAIGTRFAETKLPHLSTLINHPNAQHLMEIVCGETDISSAGYPYISDHSFRILIDRVPHLYQDGAAILRWVRALELELEGKQDIPRDSLASMERAIRVLRSVVRRAGITATTDLWLLRHVLSAHRKLGIIDFLMDGRPLDPQVFAREHDLNLDQLTSDLRFLHTRGYLRRGHGDFVISSDPAIARVLGSAAVIPERYRTDLVSRMVEFFGPEKPAPDLREYLENWLSIPVDHEPTHTWVASYFQIAVGYRLLPTVLSLRSLEITPQLKLGERLEDHLPRQLDGMGALFEAAGFTQDGRVNVLGERVFQRGPGPFGIIGAYHPYLNQLPSLLTSDEKSVWVRRGENVAASQDANRKSFSIAHDKLDEFCEQYGYEYSVFIEHAMGRGEAIRQRLERDGVEIRRYFGADLEDAAIEQARKQQKAGILPQGMELIRSADIGDPQKVIGFLEERGVKDEPIVMMVGNGFHEVREQTNQRMTEIFRQYQRAGIVLIFTEESALHDEALLRTAWNTYHAGFRYVHEMSGQGLRPAVEEGSDRWSWRRCAEEGGYVVLEELSYRNRTIYPYRRPSEKNPSISVTYFCVPRGLANELGIIEDAKP